jgi:hypothetical protein
MLNGLEGIGVGLTIGDELLLSMDLRSKTEEDSDRLYTTLQGLLAMAAASQPSEAGSPTELLRQVKMTHGARRVTATLRASTDEIQKTFAAHLSSNAPGLGSEAGPSAGAPLEGAGKIRIYGLEQEPVEVDAGQR